MTAWISIQRLSFLGRAGVAIVVTRAHLLLDRIRQPAAGHDPVGALVSDQTSGGAHLEGYEMNHQCILGQCRPAYDEALNSSHSHVRIVNFSLPIFRHLTINSHVSFVASFLPNPKVPIS